MGEQKIVLFGLIHDLQYNCNRSKLLKLSKQLHIFNKKYLKLEKKQSFLCFSIKLVFEYWSFLNSVAIFSEC